MVLLLAAHLITSRETANTRRELRQRLEAAIAPLVPSGQLEPVELHEASDLALPGALASISIDTTPSNLDDEQLRPAVQQLHVRQVSNTLKHIEALTRIAKLDKPGFALVVEDDAVFGDKMVNALTHAISDAPEDADMIFVGLPSTRLPPPSSSKSVFDDPLVLFPGQVIPACDSYIITPLAAQKLVQAWMPIRMKTALQFSYMLRKKVVKTYVAVPNVFVDGSKVGVTSSSLDANNLLIWNQPFCIAVDALTNQNGSTKPVQDKLDEVWASQPFKNHPDCLVQRADQMLAAKKIYEAQELYEKALAIYTAENCIVNTSSKFMKRYMATFADV